MVFLPPISRWDQYKQIPCQTFFQARMAWPRREDERSAQVLRAKFARKEWWNLWTWRGFVWVGGSLLRVALDML